MAHSLAAAICLLAFFTIMIGGRLLLQKVRTGEHGLRVRPTVGSVAFHANLVWVLVTTAFVSAPLIGYFGLLGPVVAPPPIMWGAMLAGLGIAAGFLSQLAMGNSWRIGLHPEERTALVRRGPYAIVRNPIYSSVIVFLFGLTLLVPNLVMLASLVVGIVDVQVQVRLVEEPYLLQTHGDAYRDYMRRVGRFVPFLGQRISH